jgi:hypothetical protein
MKRLVTFIACSLAFFVLSLSAQAQQIQGLSFIVEDPTNNQVYGYTGVAQDLAAAQFEDLYIESFILENGTLLGGVPAGGVFSAETLIYGTGTDGALYSHLTNFYIVSYAFDPSFGYFDAWGFSANLFTWGFGHLWEGGPSILRVIQIIGIGATLVELLAGDGPDEYSITKLEVTPTAAAPGTIEGAKFNFNIEVTCNGTPSQGEIVVRFGDTSNTGEVNFVPDTVRQGKAEFTGSASSNSKVTKITGSITSVAPNKGPVTLRFGLKSVPEGIITGQPKDINICVGTMSNGMCQ